MTIEDLVTLQEQGAAARLRGRPASDNPYLANVAAREIFTADSEELSACCQAWHFGWSLEDACLRDALTLVE